MFSSPYTILLSEFCERETNIYGDRNTCWNLSRASQSLCVCVFFYFMRLKVYRFSDAVSLFTAYCISKSTHANLINSFNYNGKNFSWTYQKAQETKNKRSNDLIWFDATPTRWWFHANQFVFGKVNFLIFFFFYTMCLHN